MSAFSSLSIFFYMLFLHIIKVIYDAKQLLNILKILIKFT